MAFRIKKSQFWKILQHSQIDYVLVFIGFVVVNITLYQALGARIVTDSHRYLDYADEIVERGIFLQEHNQWYLCYALYLSLLKSLGLGITSGIAGQILLSGIATICLYQTGILLFSRVSGLCAALSFLSFVEISQWNFYILCESLFISFTAISFYLIIRFHKTSKGTILTVAILLFTMFIKPTGVWLTFTGMALILNKYSRNFRPGAHRIKVVLALFGLFCLLLVNRMLGTFHLIETYTTGDLIFLASKIEVASQLTVSPANLTTPKSELPALIQLGEFIFYNPIFFAKLFFAKLFLFVVHIKPYYSNLHNGWIAATLYPSYYLGFIGLLSQKKEMSLVIFIWGFITLQAITVGSTTEDWDGRFLMPVLPVIFVMAGCGAAYYLNKFTPKRNGDN